MSLQLSLVGISIATVIAEGILWMLFSAKVKPLCFPGDAQTQCFRRLRMGPLRAFAIAHMTCTIALAVFSLLFLW